MSFILAGNSKINAALSSVLKENRIPHAILIEGDSGTGRHTLANFIANAAICSGKNIPCKECADCILAESNNHPDITVVAPEENKKSINIAQIRALRAETLVKPHRAARRVFIIDKADTMNPPSQNALLKTLEEPPQNTVFILIAKNKSILLETVISRCITFTLSVPSLEEGIEYLVKNHSFTEKTAEQALIKSHNNIGTALRLSNKHSETKTEAMAKEFLACMLRNDEFGMLKAANVFNKSRVDAELFVKDLELFIANALKEQYHNENAKALYSFYSELKEFEKNLVANVNLNLLFCNMAVKAANIMKI